MESNEQDLTPSEIRLMLYLAHRMNDDTKQCNPSLETIIKQTRLPRSTVYMALDSLKTKEIVRIDRRKKTSYYHFLILLPATQTKLLKESTVLYITNPEVSIQ